MYNIYNVTENKNTHNFYGHEIVIDGERGRECFPGKWDISEAKRHYRCGVPWDRPLLGEVHTCIISLDGKYYALGHDLFMTTIYAIGQDRIQGDHPKAVYFTGGIKERNEAIKTVCLPHDYCTAYAISKNEGIYGGQLYSGEKERRNDP